MIQVPQAFYALRNLIPVPQAFYDLSNMILEGLMTGVVYHVQHMAPFNTWSVFLKALIAK